MSAQPELIDELPSWIPVDAWKGYIEMRNNAPKAKRPTAYALELVKKRLLKFHHEGQDVGAILEQSIRNNWADVYPAKPEKVTSIIRHESEYARKTREFVEATTGRRRNGPYTIDQ